MRRVYLILEDNTRFEGESFGFDAESIGEVVFNTSMSGYQEVLTDPSYNGQIVAMTYPMIGNYGVNDEDVESDKIQVAGFVVKEYSKSFSNFRAKKSLSDYLKDAKIAAVEGIDTRRLTRHIRDKGALRGGIFFDDNPGVMERLLSHPKMDGLDLTGKVSCKAPYIYGDNEGNEPLIAVYDFGVKTNILRLLKDTGFSIKVYPGNTPLKDIKDNIKGVFLSNGPGDPDAVLHAKNLVKDIIKQGVPCFGICLGHQILGLGLGGRTYKLKFGHRGANQPVKDMASGRVEITSQNHGFAVDFESIKKIPDVEISHINLNDKTVEGMRHKKLPILSIQYHPESSPGPHDSRYLFKEFYDMVKRG